MSGHWHPESPGSDEFLRFFLLAILILIAMFFEKVAHNITHDLDHQVHEAHQEREAAKKKRKGHGNDHGHSEHEAHEFCDPKSFEAELSLNLWKRAQAELTVLGFLAFTIWSANRAQLLQVMVVWGSGLFADPDDVHAAQPHGDDAEAHHRLLSGHGDDDHSADAHGAAVDAHHGSADALGHAAPATYDGYCVPGTLPWLPPSADDLIHILEDVHSACSRPRRPRRPRRRRRRLRAAASISPVRGP